MKRLDSRIEQLEAVQAQSESRSMSDLELAVRLDYAISRGGPLAEKLLAMLAVSDKRKGEGNVVR